MRSEPIKAELHPRNRFRGGYDFPQLIANCPDLANYVAKNRYGSASVDFSDPAAVRMLNQALLKSAYGLQFWDIPPGHLCPPVPGRSDYAHLLADLLSGGGASSIPRCEGVRIMDIGVGANVIYPLIGASEYGWSFVGADIDPAALKWGRDLVAANPTVSGLIELRLQTNPVACFTGVIQAGEKFRATMCNPPFHASLQEAAAGSRRKIGNLSRKPMATSAPPILNFGGKSGELWCPGGELAFVQRMILESVHFQKNCQWFTSLISKSAHLPRLHQTLRDVKAAEVRTMEMAQGQKKSRILAWTFGNATA